MTVISHDSETPAQGQQVITACAFIHQVFDGVEKVFLAKRAATKKFYPDDYELPGGHIDFGEDTTEGLKRELIEEIGMNIEVRDPFFVFDYTNHIKGSHSIEVIYFAHFLDPITNITLHPEDHSAYGWFAEDEISQTLSETKPASNPEYIALGKGFQLLRGESVHF